MAAKAEDVKANLEQAELIGIDPEDSVTHQQLVEKPGFAALTAREEDYIQKLCLRYIQSGDKRYFRNLLAVTDPCFRARLGELDLLEWKKDWEKNSEAIILSRYPLMAFLDKFLDETHDTNCYDTTAKHAQAELAGTLKPVLEATDSRLQFLFLTDPHSVYSGREKEPTAKAMLEKFCQWSIKAANLDPDKIPDAATVLAQQNALISATLEHKRLISLQSIVKLLFLWGSFEEMICKLQHACYYDKSGDDLMGRGPKEDKKPAPILYPDCKLAEMLPPSLLNQKYVESRYLNQRIGLPKYSADLIYGPLLGKFLVENPTSKFYNWTVLSKTSGKEQGFILVSPDTKQKYFGKFSNLVIDPYMEYFMFHLMAELGIHVPESEVIKFGKIMVLLTRDMTRQYAKGEQLKQKTFFTLTDVLSANASIQAFGFQIYHGFEIIDYPLSEEQQKYTDEFLNRILGEPGSIDPTHRTARVSYAKLLIAKVCFGIADFGTHGGNVGPVYAHKAGKELVKWGIVDFVLATPERLICNSWEDFTNYLQYEMHFKSRPIFQQLLQRITLEDFKAAAQQLSVPKCRAYTEAGYFLVQAPRATKTIEASFETVIQKTDKQYTALYGERGIINMLEKRKGIYMTNLNRVLEVISKAEIEPEPAQKRQKSAAAAW